MTQDRSKMVVYVEQQGDSENNLEYVEIYDIRKDLKDRDPMESRIGSGKEKIILDIDENSQSFPDCPTKLYQLMKGGTEMILRNEERTGIKVVSL